MRLTIYDKFAFLKERKFLMATTILAITSFVFVFYGLNNNLVGAQMSDKTTPLSPIGNTSNLSQNFTLANNTLAGDQRFVTDGGITTAAQFLAHGGRSVIKISRDTSLGEGFSPSLTSYTINASRGDTVKIPLILTHLAGNNPLSSITIVGKGIADDLIPPSVAKAIPFAERVALNQQGKKIPGLIDLNSTVTFSPQSVTLKPNEVKEIDVNITMPNTWPDELVGKNVWYSVILGDSEGHERPDLFMKQIGVQIHLVS